MGEEESGSGFALGCDFRSRSRLWEQPLKVFSRWRDVDLVYRLSLAFCCQRMVKLLAENV